MVSLQLFRSHHCGGTWVGKSHVITAAHCTKGEVLNHDVVIHRHNLSLNEAEEASTRHPVLDRIVHPQFDKETYLNDIAVWKFDKPPEAGPYIRLDKGESDYSEILLVVTGWGKPEAKSVVESDILMQIKIPIYNLTKCTLSYEDHGLFVDPDAMLCAGFPEGEKDACQSDSGGPLFLADPLTLVGVVSWGLGCGKPALPGIYTRISNYIPWIDEAIKELDNQPNIPIDHHTVL